MSKLIVNDPRLQAVIRERKALEADASFRRFMGLEIGNSVPVSSLPDPADDDAQAKRFADWKSNSSLT